MAVDRAIPVRFALGLRVSPGVFGIEQVGSTRCEIDRDHCSMQSTPCTFFQETRGLFSFVRRQQCAKTVTDSLTLSPVFLKPQYSFDLRDIITDSPPERGSVGGSRRSLGSDEGAASESGWFRLVSHGMVCWRTWVNCKPLLFCVPLGGRDGLAVFSADTRRRHGTARC